jgi:predicted esterase
MPSCNRQEQVRQHADFVNERDDTGIRHSVEYISGLINKEILAGIPASRIALAGFSQVHMFRDALL